MYAPRHAAIYMPDVMSQKKALFSVLQLPIAPAGASHTCAVAHLDNFGTLVWCAFLGTVRFMSAHLCSSGGRQVFMDLHQISLEAPLHVSSLLQPGDGVPQRQYYACPLALLLGQSSLTTHTKLTVSPTSILVTSQALNDRLSREPCTDSS